MFGFRPSSMGIWYAVDFSLFFLLFAAAHTLYDLGPPTLSHVITEKGVGADQIRNITTDCCLQEPNRLDPSHNWQRSAHTRPHPRHRPSLRWLTVFQQCEFSSHSWPLDAHVHDS